MRPIDRAVLSLFERSCAGRSPSWQTRFRRHVAEYIQMYLVEAEAFGTGSGTLPSLNAYLPHRVSGGGAEICLDFIEVVIDAELPAQVLALPAYLNFREAMVLVISLANDILGYERDLRVGYRMNLVQVLYQERSYNRGYALFESGLIFQSYVLRVEEQEQLLLKQMKEARITSKEQNLVTEIIDQYKIWIYGYCAWACDNPRFSSVEV
nr:terpene synthase family protein [Acidisarcina polymorpha]